MEPVKKTEPILKNITQTNHRNLLQSLYMIHHTSFSRIEAKYRVYWPNISLGLAIP
jgi:hypothetical protein